MDKNILQLEVSSPKELQESLANHTQNGVRFAAVRVFGPDILTRQFNFPNSSTQDLITGLKHEISETLSVAGPDMELSYQITDRDEAGVYGVISAMPSKLLAEYLECFKSHSLIPVSLTASAVGAVTDFLKDQPLPGENFCLVNFLKPNAVNIIIFNSAKPVFFRELCDLSDSDFKDKIKDTIRYSCSQSVSKRIDHIFFVGDLTGKETLIQSLKQIENSPLTKPETTEVAGQPRLKSLNLFGKHVLDMAERARAIFILSLISGISVILALFLAWHFVNGNAKLQEAKLKVNMADYNRARNLQEQVRHLNHG